MEANEILKNVNREHLRMWVLSGPLSSIVSSVDLEERGFPPRFVRSFIRKQERVLRLDGFIKRGVWGVNKLEFMVGLAEALGVHAFDVKLCRGDPLIAVAAARTCLAVIELMDSGREAMPGLPQTETQQASQMAVVA